MQRLDQSADSVIAHGARHQKPLLFFYIFSLKEWADGAIPAWTVARRTLRGNSASLLRGGGCKALGTLGRKPLDLEVKNTDA